MNLKNEIKTIIHFVLNLFFGWFPIKRIAILMYHSVDYNPVFFTVKPEEFQKQMDYLKNKKYNVISFGQLLKYLQNKNIPSKTVILTFDDGYEDNYFNVFPILKRYNFPAAIFLTVGFVGKEIPNSAGIPLKALNWDQIREMHSSGLIDFEPHSINHYKLTKIPIEEMKKEILNSKNEIERELLKTCQLFCYPKGKYNQGIINFLRKFGFLGAVTLEPGLVRLNDNPFKLKRNSIDSWVGFPQFKGKLNLSVDIFRKFFKNE